MRAGSLRHKVTIQRNTPTTGDGGEDVDSWAEIDTGWASIKAKSGAESLSGGKIEALVTHTIILRYRDIEVDDRLLLGTRVFNIVSVLDMDGKSRALSLEVKEDG